jgi:hypothetical protein
MAEPTTRPGESAQQAGDATTAEPVRMGRDDPAPARQDAEPEPVPHPRRDNQREAITGGPTV